jgi:hypothetical protein
MPHRVVRSVPNISVSHLIEQRKIIMVKRVRPLMYRSQYDMSTSHISLPTPIACAVKIRRCEQAQITCNTMILHAPEFEKET